ncbi:MAG TPA: aminotransferase class III-fold pyridoxal phosphate-dependent enzyme, partial [Candidatus Saccharimonadales bacterium]|nr:aminotransferase class III-fold pyridoxal phosphate-dependent enzyme [Candidatus Saccharimonadales bacterium]
MAESARSTSEELLAIRDAALPRGLKSAFDFVAARASGSQVWDQEGVGYVDFVGGIGVLNVGHGHPKVLAAAHRQIDLLIHTSG